jgi:predicted CoA-binding protein
MAKEGSTPIPVPPAAPAEQITLDEFCTRLSQVDGRVEMIGAFNSVETLAKQFKDAEQAYQDRYRAFINAPA